MTLVLVLSYGLYRRWYWAAGALVLYKGFTQVMNTLDGEPLTFFDNRLVIYCLALAAIVWGPDLSSGRPLTE